MDKTLERILSLIPKKENGDFKHGALAQFARPLGFKDGHIVSDWIAGNSESYKNYLYQISALHGVSVAWLKGETDDPGIKKDLTENGEVGPGRKRLFDLINSLDDAQCDRFAEAIEALTRKGSE